MAHPTVKYTVHLEHVEEGQKVQKKIEVNIVLDQRSKSKAKNRIRAANKAREMYPKCVVHLVTYD